jgi:hypothetical protein
MARPDPNIEPEDTGIGSQIGAVVSVVSLIITVLGLITGSQGSSPASAARTAASNKIEGYWSGAVYQAGEKTHLVTLSLTAFDSVATGMLSIGAVGSAQKTRFDIAGTLSGSRLNLVSLSMATSSTLIRCLMDANLRVDGDSMTGQLAGSGCGGTVELSRSR